MTTPIPLAAQRAKLDRLLDERIGFYRLGVKKGTLALDAAAQKHAECEAIRRSFAWLCDNHEWIRAEARRRARLAEDRAIFDEEPAAAAVRAAFPDATVTLSPEPDVA